MLDELPHQSPFFIKAIGQDKARMAFLNVFYLQNTF